MEYRRLGRTGLQVSEVGYGAWGIGANMWLGATDEESQAAVRAALDAGITFIDTALAYGQGHSERLIASVLGGRAERDRVVVATKIPPADRTWPGRADVPLSSVFPPEWVRQCVEQSLTNLSRSELHLEQFHVWNDAWLADPAWPSVRSEMERLKAEGKVLHWGVSINDHAPHTALGILTDPLVESAQAIYNIYDRSPERQLFALVRERDLGMIARVPFDEGALTGNIRAETDFLPGDWRHRYFRGDRKAEAERHARALEPLLGEEAGTLPELALRFILSAPEVSSVIPGMRSPAHARSNAAVADGRRLSKALVSWLADHAWDKNWYAPE